jgi:8-oxo-dGTP diphosphatase
VGCHQVVVGLHLVLRAQGRVLLGVRRGSGWRDGWWHVPAGHLEAGESITAGMAREAREELGILIRPADLEIAHIVHDMADPRETADAAETAAAAGADGVAAAAGPSAAAEGTGGGDGPVDRLQIFFTARAYRGTPRIAEPHRCAELRYWPLDGLPELLVGYTRAALHGIRAGRSTTVMGRPA